MAQLVASSRPTTRLSAATAQIPGSGDKRGVQKGFLKQARSAISKVPADMKVDAKDQFAFIGFSVDSDPYEICTLIKEYCFDHLSDFNLQVLGHSQHMDNGVLVRAVGIEFMVSQRDALDSKIFELRDVWWCKQRQLSTITGVENQELFVWPLLPLPEPLSGVVNQVLDPLVKTDPWKAYLGTATESHSTPRKVTARHTGWTPELEMRKMQMNELLQRRHVVAAPLADVPGITSDTQSDVGLALVLSKLTELTVGVNELRAAQATAITRQDLQEFHEKSSLEFKAFVASRTEPLRDDLTLVMQIQDAEKERVGKLEASMEKLAKVKKSSDGSFTKLAVKKFPEDASLEERVEAMRDFMARHFPKLSATFSVRHRGNWMEKGKNRTMTAVGFIEVGDPDVREFVLREVTSRKLSVRCRNQNLAVVRAMTDQSKERNAALFAAAEILKQERGVNEADVEIVWATRSVEVRKEMAFQQPKGQSLGSFCGKHGHLALP